MTRHNPCPFWPWLFALLCAAALHARGSVIFQGLAGGDGTDDFLAGRLNLTNFTILTSTDTNIQSLLPAALEGTWFAQSCQRGTETIEGTFLLNINHRRRVTGWFTNTTEGKILPVRGMVSRDGHLTARAQGRLLLRGLLTGTTNPAINGIVLRRCAGAFESFPYPCEPPAFLPDPGLASVLSDVLGKPVCRIAESNLQPITSLVLWDRPVHDLTGLQHATNLGALIVHQSPITNFSALYGLRLQWLQLSHATNIAFLTNFQHITNLRLNQSALATVEPLLHLTNLSNLSLWATPVPDIEALAALPALTEFSHGSLTITNFAPYGALPNLEKLFLSGPALDLTPLGTLTNLWSINLNRYAHTNFDAGLSSLSRLTHIEITQAEMRNLDWLQATNTLALNVGDNLLTNVSPLAELNKLTYLNLSGNPLADSESLGQIPATVISLSVNRIGMTNLASLPEFGNLLALNADYNHISDLSPLWSGTNLGALHLAENQITSLEPLSACTRLTTLHLNGNLISDITPLASCTNLNILNLASNQISTLQGISALRRIWSLRLDHNGITNFAPLRDLKNLQLLQASHNNIRNISALTAATSLTGVYLDSNQISDIRPLKALPHLRTVSLRNNPLDLSAGSSASNVIHTLRTRGVSVDVGP